MAGSGGFGKSLAVGALLGLLVISVAVIAVLAGSGEIDWFAPTEPPGEVLVVAVTDDADGAAVGGVLLLFSDTGSIEVVDPFTEVTIPGTSYTLLRDAYAFGGGQAVVDAYAEARGLQNGPAWVVVPRGDWQALVDDAGGAVTVVPAGANVFLGDKLYAIEEGQQTLSGAELGALVATQATATPGDADRTNEAVGEALGTVLASSWAEVSALVEAGDASSSVDGELLNEFGAGF